MQESRYRQIAGIATFAGVGVGGGGTFEALRYIVIPRLKS